MWAGIVRMFDLTIVVGLKMMGPLLSRAEPVRSVAVVSGVVELMTVKGLSSLLMRTSERWCEFLRA